MIGRKQRTLPSLHQRRCDTEKIVSTFEPVMLQKQIFREFYWIKNDLAVMRNASFLRVLVECNAGSCSGSYPDIFQFFRDTLKHGSKFSDVQIRNNKNLLHVCEGRHEHLRHDYMNPIMCKFETAAEMLVVEKLYWKVL